MFLGISWPVSRFTLAFSLCVHLTFLNILHYPLIPKSYSLRIYNTIRIVISGFHTFEKEPAFFPAPVTINQRKRMENTILNYSAKSQCDFDFP